MTVIRPFIPGTVYNAGDYVRDPEDDLIYQVRDPLLGPDADVQVLAGTLSPHADTERFTLAPESSLPAK